MTNQSLENKNPKLGKNRKIPNEGNGRPKGAQNKTTKAVKEMLMAALDELNGSEYFLEQARENPAAFMSLVGKLIPTEVKNQLTGADNGPIQHAIKVKFGDDS